MVASLDHRGPDDEGVWLGRDGRTLGHTRLAIMDPERGAQPIRNEDGSATLIANGMVYNHPDLRNGLAEGHTFVSDSDSETILHLFEEQGLATPALLDGMFVFAIATDDRLVLARDPIGVKPLYWAKESGGDGGETVQFASEIKALAGNGSVVEEFPPGALYADDIGLRRYYTVPSVRPVSLDVEEHARRLRSSVELAVEKRLLSDVPVGAFLSGGLDSSIIAALASRHIPRLHTFSVGVEGASDLQAARLVARHIGTEHHELVYTEDDVVRHLSEIVYHLESFDQELVRSAIPTFFCARLASEHVKVILTGEGADELFAGYRYHEEIDDEAALHEELRRSVTCLHDLNLQRVDRMTMRHGVEARVPFLDTDVVAVAQSIPPGLKLRSQRDGRAVEKWILRKAFDDLLPDEIVWRRKAQFDEGSGMVDIMPSFVDRAAGELAAAEYAESHPRAGLRSREECLYHAVLLREFDRPEAVIANVGRWHDEHGPGRTGSSP